MRSATSISHEFCVDKLVSVLRSKPTIWSDVLTRPAREGADKILSCHESGGPVLQDWLLTVCVLKRSSTKVSLVVSPARCVYQLKQTHPT